MDFRGMALQAAMHLADINATHNNVMAESDDVVANAEKFYNFLMSEGGKNE